MIALPPPPRGGVSPMVGAYASPLGLRPLNHAIPTAVPKVPPPPTSSPGLPTQVERLRSGIHNIRRRGAAD